MVTQDREFQAHPGQFFKSNIIKTFVFLSKALLQLSFCTTSASSGKFARAGRVQCVLIGAPVLLKQRVCTQQSRENMHLYISSQQEKLVKTTKHCVYVLQR